MLIGDLHSIAENLKIKNHKKLKKEDLVFEILNIQAKNPQKTEKETVKDSNKHKKRKRKIISTVKPTSKEENKNNEKKYPKLIVEESANNKNKFSEKNQIEKQNKEKIIDNYAKEVSLLENDNVIDDETKENTQKQNDEKDNFESNENEKNINQPNQEKKEEKHNNKCRTWNRCSCDNPFQRKI